MPCLRLRYAVLGLLTYLHGAVVLVRADPSVQSSSSSSTCGISADVDVPSKTIRASIVFVGSTRGSFRRSGSSDDQRRLFDVAFRVDEVLKGRLPVSVDGLVLVGPFERQARRRGDGRQPTSFSSSPEDRCPSPPVNGSRQIVFLDGPPTVDGRLPGLTVVYQLSAKPEQYSAKTQKAVKDSACRKCVRRPEANIRGGHVSILIGQRLRLNCQAKGRPQPSITWYKDGQEVTSDERITILTARRSSRLQIAAVGLQDSGVYSCQGRSAAGLSDMAKPVEVRVRDPNSHSKDHSTLCSDQSYCLNGGTCYILDTMGKQYCECKNTYIGSRCQERRIDFPMAVVGKGPSDAALLGFLKSMRRSGRLRDVIPTSSATMSGM